MPYLPLKSLFVFIVYIVVIVLIAFSAIKRLPDALTVHDERSHPNRFIGESAWIYLKNLTTIGPRVTGSRENEVLAINYFRKQLSAIIESANKNQFKIESDLQSVSGAFPLQFLDGLTNVYHDVQNFVVKIISTEFENSSATHDLLLNCHFDSVTDSPGASDDGAGCAIMLELLRTIIKSNFVVENHIIFLFNGAEENFMQASHGFITQHSWAKQIKAFLNFEACGAGGRELLFQAGPQNSWMMKIYANSVPYPFASSIAEEVFQSGAVPADTDFRIFRDFGNLSGFDFAWASNGYVYHTLFDTIEQMPMQSLQRTGDNMLALVTNIINSEELQNIHLTTDDLDVHKSETKLLFFDVLGLFMVCVHHLVFYAFSVIVVTLSFYSRYYIVRNIHSSFRKKTCFLAIALAWVSVLIVIVLIAALLTVLDRTMSWYQRPIWILFLYIHPSLFTIMFVFYNFSKFDYQQSRNHLGLFLSYYNCNLMIWECVVMCCLVFGIRSVFLAVIWLLFTTFFNFGTSFFNIRNIRVWTVFYLAAIAVPIVQSYYLIISALQLFIPLMGRSGASHNSEIVIAILVGVMFCTSFMFVAPLIVLVRKPVTVLYAMFAVFLISISVLIFSNYGFPYSGSKDNPTPQRYVIIHCNRIVHRDNSIILNQTGYWVVDMDINSPTYVKSYLPNSSDVQLLDRDCNEFLYCALPYIISVKSIYSKTHWIQSSEDPILMERKPTLQIRRKTASNGLSRLDLEINGPDHFQVMLSPLATFTLTNWSLVNTKPLAGPKWNNRDTYFVYHSYTKRQVPLIFTLYFEVPTDFQNTEKVVEIAVCGHIVHGDKKTSEKFLQFLHKFPEWTAVSAWTASYESWII